MKRLILLALAGLSAIAIAGPSLGADLPRKAAPYYTAPFSWSGFYVGINGGYGWGKSSWTLVGTGATTGDFNTKGGLAGGTIGYNLQTGNWVWGLEGDLDASWIKGSDTATCGGIGCETRNRWLATGRGRIGYAWDRFLPFITGGAAFGDIRMTTPASTSQTTTKVGWTAGGGVEYAFMGPWSAKVEYLYVDLGKGKCDAGTCGGGNNFEATFKTNIVRLGVNYRF